MPRVRLQAIIPKVMISSVMKIRAEKIATEITDGIEEDFERTVRDWEHDVKWRRILHYSGNRLRFGVSTKSELFKLVDEGAPKHNIPLSIEKKSFYGPMIFSSKSTPGVLISRKGIRSGFQHTRLKVIEDHPGFKARDFTGAMVLKWDQKAKYKFLSEFQRIREELAI